MFRLMRLRTPGKDLTSTRRSRRRRSLNPSRTRAQPREAVRRGAGIVGEVSVARASSPPRHPSHRRPQTQRVSNPLRMRRRTLTRKTARPNHRPTWTGLTVLRPRVHLSPVLSRRRDAHLAKVWMVSGNGLYAPENAKIWLFRGLLRCARILL